MTVSIPLSRDSHCNPFAVCRGTEAGVKVSIPLSRDSHCNNGNPLPDLPPTRFGFNPSVEGQPLQQKVSPIHLLRKYGFNPSVEGQPLQQKVSPIHLLRKYGFNPSVEGQPLQQTMVELKDENITLFQSLCRGTAIATPNTLTAKICQCLFQSLCRGTAIATSEVIVGTTVTTLVSIPLSRDSHCNKSITRWTFINHEGFNPSVEGQPLQLE